MKIRKTFKLAPPLTYIQKTIFEGTNCSYKCILHNVDGPALKNEDGLEIWYVDGIVHRENGPAITNEEGDLFWYKNGVYHRSDGPAIEWVGGRKDYYLDGVKVEPF